MTHSSTCILVVMLSMKEKKRCCIADIWYGVIMVMVSDIGREGELQRLLAPFGNYVIFWDQLRCLVVSSSDLVDQLLLLLVAKLCPFSADTAFIMHFELMLSYQKKKIQF